jgi:hypothetical protein
MPNAEVNVFSELRLAETGLHVFPDIQNGKLIGKYLKHIDTGLIIPLDLASGIVVVKTDPKFDARQLDMDDGAELAPASFLFIRAIPWVLTEALKARPLVLT